MVILNIYLRGGVDPVLGLAGGGGDTLSLGTLADTGLVCVFRCRETFHLLGFEWEFELLIFF